MKLAIFSESPADDTALRILAEAILGAQTEIVLHAGLRTRGWPSVRNVLRAVLLELHYHTDADAFVLVVDSNGAPPHESSHDRTNAAEAGCRLCQLRRIRDAVLSHAKPRTNRPALRTAIGLAVPAIEAWLLRSEDVAVNEAQWLNGIASGRPPYSTRQLKNRLYGTDRPSLALETERMKKAALQLSQDARLLEEAFPSGFGALARDIRTW